MIVEMDPSDYPITEEESDLIATSIDQGQIEIAYGSGTCSLEEANDWYLNDKRRLEELEKESKAIENSVPEPN